MFTAKPNMNNTKGIKQFKNIKEAVNYLNLYTEIEEYGARLTAEDWNLIGKLESDKPCKFKANKVVDIS